MSVWTSQMVVDLDIECGQEGVEGRSSQTDLQHPPPLSSDATPLGLTRLVWRRRIG